MAVTLTNGSWSKGSTIIRPTATFTGTADGANPRVWTTVAPFPGPEPTATGPILGAEFPVTAIPGQDDAPVTGLAPNTAYQWVMWYQDDVQGVTRQTGVANNDTTLFPTSCSGSGSITDTTVELSGNSHNVFQPNQVGFVWGTTPGGPFPNEQVDADTLPNGEDSLPYADTIAGLTPGTTYFFRSAEFDDLGNVVSIGGADCQFTTTGVAPTDPVECTGADQIRAHQATMNGTYDTGLVPAGDNVSFATYSDAALTTQIRQAALQVVPTATPGTFENTIPHNGPVGNAVLQPSTQYWYTAQHWDAAGTTLLSESAPCTFTTEAEDLYIECNPNNNIPRSRTMLRVGVLSIDPFFPAQLADDQLRVEVGPTAAGPWVLADLFDALGANPAPNPVSGINPGGGLTHLVGNLLHNTEYFSRITLLNNTPGPNPQEVQSVICGPIVTRDRPNPLCAIEVTNITSTGANLRISTNPLENPGGPSLVGRFEGGDTATIEVSTVPGGPYTPAGSLQLQTTIQATIALSMDVPVTGLQPGTEYFYRIRMTEEFETGAEYWLSPECPTSFTTLAANAQISLTKAANCVPGATVPENVVSTVTVSNAGPDPITDTLVDNIPAAPAGGTRLWSSVSAGGATGSAGNGAGNINEELTLPVGGSVTYTVTDSFPGPLGGVYVNEVSFGDITVQSNECQIAPLPQNPEGPTVTIDCEPPCAPNAAQSLPTRAPCMTCDDAGAAGGGDDTEQLVLCDIDAEGNLLGTALAVYVYDENGNPVGAPTFVDPATGAPYVPQGTLQPCPIGDCGGPLQFCFTSTTTGPVQNPGRLYDIDLPINPGFAVESLQIDGTNYPANITWAVTDADGELFRAALEAFLAPRFPTGTVTVTNPNAGTPVCGEALPMQVHIECIRIDEPAPNIVELFYNGGVDAITNPAYLTTPPTNLNGPQFVYLQRQDAGGTLNCTSVANRGWETNDLGPNATRDFELWGTGPGGLQTIQDTTPTPRGTPVQEITADINDTGPGPTIWQTFNVAAAGTFKLVLVHGARDAGETHTIRLSTGDTDDVGPGDIINNVTVPAQVTNAGGGTPGAWTSFEQDVFLNPGTYTFSFTTTNPVGNNRGGLFTDMRAFVDAPGQRAAAVTDDETCTVETEETVSTTDCQLWQPQCSNGDIVGWRKVDDGTVLTNAAFWGQAPAPECCAGGAGGGGSDTVTAGNMVHNYEVCAVVGGVPRTAQRVVIQDQSGGVIGDTFVGTDGGPIVPTSWTMGACPVARIAEIDQYDTAPIAVCFSDGLITTTWYTYERVRFNNDTAAEISRVRRWYDPVAGVDQTTLPAGVAVPCNVGVQVVESEEMGCADDVPWARRRTGFFDSNGQLLTVVYTFVDSDGNEQPLAPAGFVLGDCASCCPEPLGEVCWDDGAGSTGRAFAVRLADGTMQYIDVVGGGDISAAFIVECAEDQPVETINGTVTRVASSAAGNVAAGAAGVTITNVGVADGTVAGAPINPGETVILNAYYDYATRQFVRIPQIAYDGTGTTLHITRQA